ncbi:polysaccharide biosynthesis/export family protein [Rhodobacter maris]|uniref:Polysaccharide export outer membrane protein n=1 Tax=Rhodobacter maris TaxID=446682 RepID=A0A285SKD7_9RHOB|nr:polysaccharide biosynthesis/export family protein [Rhodobacter maris]SOC06438.1 polysaccharide export outer membrane protein [Rhodobacter maris]
MSRLIVSVCLIATMLAGASCTAPRGAALSREIMKDEASADQNFAVMRVGRDNIAQIRSFPTIGAQQTQRWPQAHRGADTGVIDTGDTVDLMIWDSQANSLLTQTSTNNSNMAGLVVTETGEIFVPYAGNVSVRGLTPTQARASIQKALEPISPTAQIQLNVKQGRLNTVDVVSGVARPGSFALLDRNTSVLSVIAQAGGIPSGLRNPDVRLIRDGKTYQIAARDLLSDANRNIPVRGNDKIVVLPDERYFTAIGATGTQEIVYFSKDRLTAIEALAEIGGLSATRADPKGLIVLREYPASAVKPGGPERAQMVFAFDMTSADGLFAARKFQIYPEDTVVATEASLTVTRNILSTIGSVLGVVRTTETIVD